MKRKTTKKVSAYLLIISILLTLSISLSSCKSEKQEEQSTTQSASEYNQEVYAPTDDEASVLTQAEQTTQEHLSTTTAKNEITTAAPASTQAQVIAEPEITGTVTKEDSNKTIVYPNILEKSNKRYPVIVWANGTGCPTSSYMSLLQNIAQAGYIVVADSSVMTADGTSQRDSIDYIIRESSNSSSIFYNKVDTVSIGASGHSQGGRSCVNAAQADSRIKCIVSIAGASSAQEANGLKTPALYLTGTSDMIVVSSQWVKPSYDASAGRAVYASLKNAAHTVCMTNPEKISGYAIKWFDAYLKGDSNAMNVFAPDGQLSNDSAWQDFETKN